MTLPAVTCPRCGRHFSRQANLKQHVRDAHEKPPRKPRPKPDRQFKLELGRVLTSR